MKTYLVTGAAGFIGSQLAASLLEDGHTVITVDNLSTGFADAIPKGAVFIKGNCQDQSVIDRLYQWKFDAVYHIAGQSSGEVSYDDPVYDLQTNTQSTLQLLQMCVKTGCRKFIYASSMSVYGDVEEAALPVNEDGIQPAPKSFYGIGKLASEHYLRIFTQQYGIGTAALRLFNVYGPGQNLENLRQGMVSIFLAQALRYGNIHVKGSADRFRDFVYIDDVVRAFSATEKELIEAANMTLNICTGQKTTVGEIVTFIKEKAEKEISVRFEGNTPGDQFGIYGRPGKAVRAIKWEPKVDFTEGMNKMIEWAKTRH
ncbi:UDP-glucose 4-epimerase [Cyclonatronum proteinivorum]|uniref:UDP-glucose 4-epimerase n=1 Tax=Cyclonatronum proteinivorum TaxID=1457365 RepID=A0A345UMJ3_9BACT|nr:NAD-dependent epimerase/dehydratase family protein [Cyclonatronum proteinivorum]AXJ01695.1 UDP-glucose 4-epimerase [Cyclonatronum proteinivorum]